MDSIENLRRIALDIRRRVITMIYSARMGHMGGSLSSVDILVALYFYAMKYDPKKPDDPGRDRFILSKGHSVEGFYAVLARAGFFPESVLGEYGSFGTMLYGHPTLKVPGVEVPSGSLGHGLSVGAGMALAAKRSGSPSRVFVLMGDGEQAEGSVWEAAMAAGHYGLDKLTAIIDANRLQISGEVGEVMDSSPLAEKYRSFGWSVREVDGHDFEELTRAFDEIPWEPGKPSLLIARTIKGRGPSFMENNAAWHHKTPSQEEYFRALRELEAEAALLPGSMEGGGK
ncbi:MAG TPA: transketolase [Rectinemataceae bacterium]